MNQEKSSSSDLLEKGVEGAEGEGSVQPEDGKVTGRVREFWTEEHKFNEWFRVELALVRAWADEEDGPDEEDWGVLARWSGFDLDLYKEKWPETRHDMIVFNEAVVCTNERWRGSWTKAKRWWHYGVTSSDVQDTALNLILRDTINAANKFLFRERWPGWLPYYRLAHYLTELLSGLHDQLGYGQFSGPVGTHSTVPPTVEERACEELGLKPEPISNQIIPRDRHAEFVMTVVRVIAMVNAQLRAYGHVAMMDDVKRWVGPALENVALWHERDLSHSSVERMMLPELCIELGRTVDFWRSEIGRLAVEHDG